MLIQFKIIRRIIFDFSLAYREWLEMLFLKYVQVAMQMLC